MKKPYSILLFIFLSLNYVVFADENKEKILIVVTSCDSLMDGTAAGYYLPELTDYHKVLAKHNYEFVVASPKGGDAPMFQKEDFMKSNYYTKYLDETGLMEKIKNTIPLAAINAEEYSAVHCVGGYASLMDFPDNPDLKRILLYAYENNKIISAVCHGPSALLNVKLSNGKYLVEGLEITSRSTAEENRKGKISNERLLQVFPILLEEELVKQGAVFTKKSPLKGHVAISGNLVTGQGTFSTTRLAEEVLELLQKTN